MQMFFQKITKSKKTKKIYITEFIANNDYYFQQTGESVLMVGQNLKCWPTLKIESYFSSEWHSPYGTENKHDIICIYHPYHTK